MTVNGSTDWGVWGGMILFVLIAGLIGYEVGRLTTPINSQAGAVESVDEDTGTEAFYRGLWADCLMLTRQLLKVSHERAAQACLDGAKSAHSNDLHKEDFAKAGWDWRRVKAAPRARSR